MFYIISKSVCKYMCGETLIKYIISYKKREVIRALLINHIIRCYQN